MLSILQVITMTSGHTDHLQDAAGSKVLECRNFQLEVGAVFVAIGSVVLAIGFMPTAFCGVSYTSNLSEQYLRLVDIVSVPPAPLPLTITYISEFRLTRYISILVLSSILVFVCVLSHGTVWKVAACLVVILLSMMIMVIQSLALVSLTAV